MENGNDKRLNSVASHKVTTAADRAASFTKTASNNGTRVASRTSSNTSASVGRSVSRKHSYLSGSPINPPKWTIIVNGKKRKQWNEVSSRLLKQLRNAKYSVVYTERVGHAISLAEQASQNGVDMIIVVGGDGTLNEAVDGVMRAASNGSSKPVISVLPLGRQCNFHRSMFWDPTDFEKNMWRLGHGSLAALDVCRVSCDSPNGVVVRHFINVASCGASALAAFRADRGNWLPATLSTSLSFLKYHKTALGMSLDEGQWMPVNNASMIAIGNGSSFGSGLKIAPSADPYDGELQVVVTNLGMWSYIRNAGNMRAGSHLQNTNKFSTYTCARIDVAPLAAIKKNGDIMQRIWDARPASNQTAGESTAPAKNKALAKWGAVPLEIDGEVIGYAPFSVELIPQAIKLMI